MFLLSKNHFVHIADLDLKTIADEFEIFDENDNERPRPIKIKPY